MGKFYWLFHNFCTHGSSLQGWSLHPYSESSVLACAMASISISLHLPPWPRGDCGRIGPGSKCSRSLMRMLSGCGEAFWSIRGGEESVESNRSEFAELYQMFLATLPEFVEQNWSLGSLILWLMEKLVCQIIIHLQQRQKSSSEGFAYCKIHLLM